MQPYPGGAQAAPAPDWSRSVKLAGSALITVSDGDGEREAVETDGVAEVLAEAPIERLGVAEAVSVADAVNCADGVRDREEDGVRDVVGVRDTLTDIDIDFVLLGDAPSDKLAVCVAAAV